ncbi:MAG: FecR domain-containing protein [Rhodoferax sp.]|uniref:DUF6600 domain-containing protein n=1 Tax=Rhodoferax sp. TaxID=50421 RepID=UPI0026179617|nr:DUF6600 domain-containing protein [Rhodoferax sp.]MDD5332511.1 FecR domain-containing protein [Rhodoferax sp.]
MQKQSLVPRALALVLGVAVFAFSGAASADPPARIARLGYTAGAVSFSPAGENDWVQAVVNRPLSNGDRLWVDAGARAEIQDGGSMLRLNANTSVSVLNLDDRITQLQLTQGILNIRVRRLAAGQVLEVDTPNLAFTLRQSGDYRIAVDPDGNATDVIVRQGQAEVSGQGAGYIVDAQQGYRFRGSDLRDNEFFAAPRPDEFDRWAGERDRVFDNSVSARYVSRDVVGYQDLDANGSWRVDANYGNVWIPSRVAADWVPYRDGHWAWVDPWGWTWVDNAPWGFAVSHYGRWANLGSTWCWVPGPVRSTAYYAPALVVFVGGDNFRLTLSSGNVGGVAWFPLAPREVYRPSYPASRTYFENVNRSNTVINNTVINNTYNTYNTTNVTNVVYANRQVPGAVIAVPRNTFVQSQSVAGARVRLSGTQLAGAPLVSAPRVMPTEQSVHGAGGPRERPPGRVFERPVVAVTAPPAPHPGFAAQQQQLTLNPGKPLDDAARKELKPGAAAALAPVIKVLAPAPAAPSAAPPAAPALLPAARPVAPVPQMAPQPVKPGLPVTPPQERRGNADQRAGGPQRAQAVAPSPAQRVVEPRPIAPQVVPSAPATPVPPQRLTPPKPALPSQVAVPAAAPGATQLAPRPPVAASKPAPPPAQIPAEPKAQQHGPGPARGNDQQRAPPVPSPVPHVPEPRLNAPQVAAPAAAPAARPVEPRPPVAVHRPAPAPGAEPHGPASRPAVSRPNEMENGRDAVKRQDENREPKR